MMIQGPVERCGRQVGPKDGGFGLSGKSGWKSGSLDRLTFRFKSFDGC